MVLVDFWATWCGPCIAEIPNVKSNYNKYHTRGFEVVGISLDHDQRSLQRFVERESLPWVQLFDNTGKSKQGWQHPMAARYGVAAIPAAFLVDQQGKVISMSARGPELEHALEKLLGKAN